MQQQHQGNAIDYLKLTVGFENAVNAPLFNADSAYQWRKSNRLTSTTFPMKAHADSNWFKENWPNLKCTGLPTEYVDLIAYTGTLLKARNIIGSYKPDTKKRIALFTWDSRPWADADPDPKNHNTWS